MLRINNRGFKRSYVYGGTGIFDSIAKAAVSLLPVVQKGALQVGKTLGEKGVQKVSSFVSRSRDKPSKFEDNHISDREHSSARLTSKSQDILRKYTAPPPPPEEHSSWSGGPQHNFNLNALIDGSAIRIEDYIKRLKK